ncbi:helix-turn-helix transcriptional regulator [Microbacterium sp. W4I20]|uniref:helix-turn-helix domain-containing protein n=1 Tax=Microbacterium sp. W4I20 TaxID=3042262 RepID=UPI002789B670|nr:helix-turn-helix transcriptional regulator [Microbacterium sp. W4I20]MDQ0728856.1 hypothetical protein [Microbacterium sp. W4I20]
MRSKEGHLVASAVEGELQRVERSVAWLAEHTGIDPAALSSMLQEREDFTMVDLANIAAALDVPVAALTPSRQP